MKFIADKALENQRNMHKDDRRQCAARRRGRVTVRLQSDPITNNLDKFSKILPTELILSHDGLNVVK